MAVDWIEYGYLGVFVGCFLSATILPLPSEALVLGALKLDFAPVPVLVVATVGNWLGGLTNYWLGNRANNPKILKRFGLDKSKIVKWEERVGRWGYWLGFLSWIPFIGDPMLVALGFLKVQFWPLALTIFLGKFIRYVLLIWLFWSI